MSKRQFAAYLLIALVLNCGICGAGVITYQDRPEWLSAIDPSTSQSADFNSFVADVRFVPSAGPLDAGPFSLSANKILSSSEVLVPNKVDVAPFFPDLNLDGTPYTYILVERDSNLTVTVTFDTPVLAFGADFNRVDGAPGESLDLVLTLMGGGSQTVQAPDPDSFFGFVSDAELITEFVFQGRTANGTDGGTGFGMDNATLGFDPATVPEPSTMSLLLALAACVLVKAAKRKASCITKSPRG